MVNEEKTPVAPKKRGRPPGTKNKATASDKPKAKLGRPANVSNRATPAKSPRSKSGSKGIRYNFDRQREIVAFIQSQGRGGMSQAKAKFGVSFPTLARWVKQAGAGNGSAKTVKGAMKIGRPKKSESVPSGHVLVSKKVMKHFQKGIANLEAAFSAFSNALRVLE